MRIGYFADGPWAHRAIERIAADSRHEIAFIVPRYDTRDPVLADWARRLRAEFLLLEDVNTPASLEILRAFDVDIFVSMSYNQIFRSACIALPPLGIINCHAGALPFYRGRNILNWALINDEKRFGVTVHYIDGTIDTGDLIVQRFVAITDTDSYACLLDAAIDTCGVALYDALDLIERGQVQRVLQASIHPVGSYFGRRRPGDEWIDWGWTSRRIFNFVRAISPPGPCAMTLRDGTMLRVLSAEMIERAPDYIATEGEVVGVSARGATVKTGDSTLLLTAVETADSRPLRIGDRLGLQATQEVALLRQQVTELEQRLARLERQPPTITS